MTTTKLTTEQQKQVDIFWIGVAAGEARRKYQCGIRDDGVREYRKWYNNARRMGVQLRPLAAKGIT